MNFSQEEIQEFMAEAFELLDVAEKKLLGLESGESFKSSYDCIFRSLHNLKGAAGMMELTTLQAHIHELETQLMSQKDSNHLPKESIDFFLRGVDTARKLMSGETVTSDSPIAFPIDPCMESSKNSTSSNPFSADALNEYLSECEELFSRLSEGLRSYETKNNSKETIDNIYRDTHSLTEGIIVSFRIFRGGTNSSCDGECS